MCSQVTVFIPLFLSEMKWIYETVDKCVLYIGLWNVTTASYPDNVLFLVLWEIPLSYLVVYSKYGVTGNSVFPLKTCTVVVVFSAWNKWYLSIVNVTNTAQMWNEKNVQVWWNDMPTVKSRYSMQMDTCFFSVSCPELFLVCGLGCVGGRCLLVCSICSLCMQEWTQW